MNIEQFLEGENYKWIQIHGDVYHLQRDHGDEWFIYNHTNIDSKMYTFDTFAAAVEEYLRLEAKKQEPTK